MYIQVPHMVPNLVFLYSQRGFSALVPSCSSSAGERQGERLPVKTEAKKLLNTSAFSFSVDTRLPFLLLRWACFL